MYVINILVNWFPFDINRDNAKRLVYENDMLQMQMSSTERDTLDVISYLKQEDAKKDEQVCHKYFTCACQSHNKTVELILMARGYHSLTL